jgi:SNF2 family DNA or RNA helicase
MVSESIAPNFDLVLDPELIECPHCSADVDGFSNYCYNCGELLAEMVSKSKDSETEPNGEMVECPNCNGSGIVPKSVRIAKQIASPKTKILEDILDEHEDVGRLVIYAGFTGSIDRCVETCRRLGWDTIRVDGRGWDCSFGRVSDMEALTVFQDQLIKYPKVAYVAHPASGGMGVTLTASPTTVYYSNDFNYESRAQSEDRIHRIGMDLNRGATIIDLIHLPSDELVLDNLRKKERLQGLTMGRFIEQIKKIQQSKTERIS